MRPKSVTGRSAVPPAASVRKASPAAGICTAGMRPTVPTPTRRAPRPRAAAGPSPVTEAPVEAPVEAALPAAGGRQAEAAPLAARRPAVKLAAVAAVATAADRAGAPS